MLIQRQMTFEQLARLPLVGHYEKAFRKATGIALKLVPAGTPAERVSLGTHENSFCRLTASYASAETACWKNEAEVLRLVGQKLKPQMVKCFAGLCVIAAPVMVAGDHVATWVGGQVFAEPPTPETFTHVTEQLTKWGMGDHLEELQSAYFRGRVVPSEQLRAVKQLLSLFAQHLGQSAERLWDFSKGHEPQCVVRAKEFLRKHATQRVTLAQVAGAVNVSPYHFCRVFRKATGLTLTGYVARLRVERAKISLADKSARINEAAYAAGFGSIPQFNTVFRRHVGMSPTQYRESLGLPGENGDAKAA